MKANLFKIRLRTLFVLTAVAVVLAATASISMTALYLASIACVAIAANYILRFRFDQNEISAGFLVVIIGATWGSFAMGLYTAFSQDAVSGFFGCLVGSLIGFFVSFIATIAFGLIPRQGLDYVTPTPPSELTGAGFEPFTDTQGY